MMPLPSRCAIFGMLLATLPFGLTSCQGPAGSDGSDAPHADIIGPEVRLISPEANAAVYTDTLTLKAGFPEGSDDVVRLEFFVNGTSDLGYGSAVVFPPTTQYTVDLQAAGVHYGSLTLGVAASDDNGNVGRSGLRLVFYTAPGQPISLAAWKIQGTTAALRVPQTATAVTSTDLLSLDIYSLAFRFSAPVAASLDSVEIHLTQRSNPLPLGPLYLTLHPAVADSPGVPLDTFFFQPDPFDLNGTQALDLSAWHGDSTAWTVSPGDYFLALGAPDSLGSQPHGIDLSMTSRQVDYPQADWGSLWMSTRDALGVERWERGTWIDTTVVFYPQVTVWLKQVVEP